MTRIFFFYLFRALLGRQTVSTTTAAAAATPCTAMYLFHEVESTQRMSQQELIGGRSEAHQRPCSSISTDSLVEAGK